MAIPPRQPHFLLLGALSGVFLALLGPLPAAPPSSAGWLLLLVAGAGLGCLPLLRPGLPPGPLVLSGLLLGFCGAAPGRPQPPDPLPAPAGEALAPRRARGVLRATRPAGRSRLGLLHLERLEGRPERRVLSVSLPPSAPPVGDGDRIEALLRLRPWPRPSNPGERDEGARLLARGVAGRAQILSLVRLETPRRGLPGRWRAALQHHLERGRRRVRATLEATVPDPTLRALLTALSLGDGSTLPPPTRRTFARAGLSHLLAVSGLHLGLLVLGLYGLLLRGLVLLLGRRPPRGVLGGLVREHPVAAAAALAGLLTGLLVSWMAHPASGMRAGAMVLPLFLGLALRRRPHPLRALLAALLLLLLWEPSLLSRVGFQLSCAAAAGLVLGAGRREGDPHLPRRPLAGLVEATFWATLSTAPLVLHHFGRLPAAGLVSNLLAIPLTGLLLLALTPATLVAALLGPQGTPALAFLPATGLAHGLASLARLAAGLPGASLLLAPPSAWQHLAFLLLLLPVPWLRPGPRRGLALLALGVLLWPTGVARPPLAPLELTFLDVGHGDAVLIRTAAGDLLVDGGGDHRGALAVGERRVVPALRALGVDRLEAVFLTHPHPDHLGGLEAVLEAFPVGALYLSGEGLEDRSALGGPPSPLAAL
ncbi:MAG: ComEC/Rec2 family competence protein, partial [Deltaproteobacteria bacterium]|nr:ComEC/Rec2 family competence protein [Deltaproteobacteria bacterium]